MSFRSNHALSRRTLLAALLAAGCWLLADAPAQAQFLNQQVGGVSINADGILSTIQRDQLDQLKRERDATFQSVPGDLVAKGLRKISLRAVESALAEHLRSGESLADDVRYLGGLQQIQFVFVYPERGDVVIAGPAEGWKLNALGEVVGVTTDRPVLLLDDLLVALRSIQSAQSTGITCSIDPTNEGLNRCTALLRQAGNPGANVEPLLRELERVTGMQTITVQGVPDTSHFARVLVAADYRMKRIAMGFEESPIRGLPSYLSMVKSSSKRALLPRWWLEPRYDAILASEDGLAYELRGSSVKCMTEDQFLNASGQRKATGKVDGTARKWSDLMTSHYDELSRADAVFGQLRNCVDMAVLAALVMKENLPSKSGWTMPVLTSAEVPVERYHAPHQVDSLASAVDKNGTWIVSVSGGVMINPWQPLANPKPSPELGAVRTKAAGPANRWTWD